MPINTQVYSQKLRNASINLEQRSVFISRLADSEQAVDFTTPTNCHGYGRVHHFRKKDTERWSDNPLPILPAAKALELGSLDMIRAQVFQNGACNWRCWYCFVPYKLLAAKMKYGAFLTAKQLIDMYLEIEPEERPQVIDLSGGQPDLIPEWTLWIMEELHSRNLSEKVFLWADDNLSNQYFWDYLSRKNIEFMASYRNYARVGCFKGYDEASFAFNTAANGELFSQQFEVFNKLLAEGFDIYAYATFTAPPHDRLDISISRFMDRLQQIHHNLPLRTVPLEIKVYSPTSSRLNLEHNQALRFQYDAHTQWQQELSKRFSTHELTVPINEVSIKK